MSYDGLLPRALPNFRLPRLAATQRGLVIGMGGGCDVLAAQAVAQAWQRAAEPGAVVIFANCVSPREMPGHEQLAPHLWRCPAEVIPLEPGDQAYGSTRLEQSLERGAEGLVAALPTEGAPMRKAHDAPACSGRSPLLFVVPCDGKSKLTVEEVTSANTAAVTSSLATLRLDAILAVDLGGDSTSKATPSAAAIGRCSTRCGRASCRAHIW